MNATPVLGAPIVEPAAPFDVSVEANRCLNCYDAPCTVACPTSTDIPRFIRRIATGDLAGSARNVSSRFAGLKLMTDRPLYPVDGCISMLRVDGGHSAHTWREQLSTPL